MKSLKQKNEEIRVEEKRKITFKKMYLESFFIIKKCSNSDHLEMDVFWINI